tara:strand:- start:938 stop:1147 length:210 start_codon:yes stop_codon:yes gene_type:complete
MKNLDNSVKKKLTSKYLDYESRKTIKRGADINELLNRVKLNRKSDIQKKFYFSAAASTGLILFGLVIFS